jgi:hypothetical protein
VPIETAPIATTPIETAPAGGDYIPADPTQLPPIAHGHSGCGCASCRGGAQTGPPPGLGPKSSWFIDDCPKPVLSEGWCRRPFYIDVFSGTISGNELVDDQVAQHTSFFGGVRLGWDLDEGWGWEGRLGWAEVEVNNIQAPSQERTADLFLWDVSLVHYFASDLRIRPFVSVGVGVVDWNFTDASGASIDESVVGVPLSIGVKQRYDDWLVFRLDLTDNMAFGGGTVLGTQHNFSCTAACELRFGGPRISYWPWQPRKYYSW